MGWCCFRMIDSLNSMGSSGPCTSDFLNAYSYTCTSCPLYLPLPLHSLSYHLYPPCVAVIGHGTRCRLLVRGGACGQLDPIRFVFESLGRFSHSSSVASLFLHIEHGLDAHLHCRGRRTGVCPSWSGSSRLLSAHQGRQHWSWSLLEIHLGELHQTAR